MHVWGKYNTTHQNGYKDVLGAEANTVYQSNSLQYVSMSYDFDSTTGIYTLTNAQRVTGTDLINTTMKYLSSAVSGSEIRQIISVIEYGAVKNALVDFYFRQAVSATIDVKGDYIGEVTANDKTAYPTDGVHTDGYWYVYIGEKTYIGQVNIRGVMRRLTGEGYVNKNGVLYPITLSSKVAINGVLKSLLIGKNPSRLPDGYTELEYIQSSGAQYIDTGVVLEYGKVSDVRLVLDFECIGDSGGSTRYIAGTRTAQEKQSFYIVYSANRYFSVGYYNQLFNSSTPYAARHLLDFNRNVCTLDGAVHTFPAYNISNSYSIYLGTVNTKGAPASASNAASFTGRIYSCQIYKNDVLVRDLVPCKNSSGAVGLYDLVNGTFCANAGSGSFTAGAEI